MRVFPYHFRRISRHFQKQLRAARIPSKRLLRAARLRYTRHSPTEWSVIQFRKSVFNHTNNHGAERHEVRIALDRGGDDRSG
jgi:hypothetical protein